jgi:amino acid transporter/nucleotide-binding universal stress UspA family protein
MLRPGDDLTEGRSIGLLGATGVGVGAIVGGGILALAGVAFATTGPSAVIAFGANGLIALLTALTFAEMATSFPESGGTYTFAKKVLSVEAAFMVGWVVWFASIVAAVLYALGFGTFAAIFLEQLWASGTAPEWLRGHSLPLALALAAAAFYTAGLVRRNAGGGQWETAGKVVVFVILIGGGLWALAGTPPAVAADRLRPFFAYGGLGLIQAMGYTFIALQGFDLIAAIAGEVKAPRRNLPPAMVGSLVIALVIYIPLLLILAVVGVPEGGDILTESRADPEAVVVAAVERYLGRPGLWLVLVAALLSMLSALQANLLAASRIALAMARDRNLPGRLRQLDPRRGTPAAAVLATSATAGVILLVIPDLAAAGAVSSLIFLLSFALAHWTSILARRRGGGATEALRLPLFPLIQVVGGAACLGLAAFQGLAVPSAGILGAVWLAFGAALYVLVFSHRARVADAAAEALDPQLVRLRGRNPLVLVPIANPASAEALVTLASAMAPPRIGRVLLLYVVQTPERWRPGEAPPQLLYAQQVLGESLAASFAAELTPEALTTVAPQPWQEISRVARTYRCESLLLGLGAFDDENLGTDLEWLLSEVDSDVVLTRIPPGWNLSDARRVLVPVGGRRDQSGLRARLLGSLSRSWGLEVVYLGVLRPRDGVDQGDKLEREIRGLAADEVPGHSRVEILRRDRVSDAVVERAAAADLVILGLRRSGRRRKTFGEIPRRVARETGSAVLMISRRG